MQGLRSALLSDLSPLNVLQHAPDPTGRNLDYSPLWNLHVAASGVLINCPLLITFSRQAP